MSSRLLSIAAVVFMMVSSAALACPGAQAKSADGSQQHGVSSTQAVKGS